MTPDTVDYERELARKDAELEALKALLVTQDVPTELADLRDELAQVKGELKDAQKELDTWEQGGNYESDAHEAEITALEEAHAGKLDGLGAAVEDLCISLGLPRHPSPVDLKPWPSLQRLVDIVRL